MHDRKFYSVKYPTKLKKKNKQRWKSENEIVTVRVIEKFVSFLVLHWNVCI